MHTLDLPRICALRHGGPVSIQTFDAHVETLAKALPERRHLINFCENRYLFAVVLAAALVRRQVTLLPADRGARGLHLLDRRFSDALLVTDSDEPPDHREVFKVGPTLPIPARLPPSRPLSRPSPDQPAVIAFTSGSTGDPEAHPKTWGSLCESARLIGSALALPEGATVVATVPAQHMYGLELSVLVPLVRGLALDAAKPFFPADIAGALRAAPAPRILVTTPPHLRVLAASAIELPPLELIVSATAPLTAALAAECERRFGVRVMEIYGCTEAGSLASRRTAVEADWTWFDTVRLTEDGGVCRVTAPHLARPVELADLIDPLDSRRFRLRGRAADLVNIAGKRHSLGALDRLLNEIEGVVDGAFFIPEETEDGRPVRPVAFAVAPGLSAEDILRCLRPQLDPVFVPRNIHLLDALPRNETGKLPRQALEDIYRRYTAAGMSVRSARAAP